MDFQEAGLGGNAWVDLAQDRNRWWELANLVMNLSDSIGFRHQTRPQNLAERDIITLHNYIRLVKLHLKVKERKIR